MSKQLDGALAALARGMKVFPIRPNLKTPAINGWQEWALKSNEKEVKDYAKLHPNSNWGVFASGSDKAILDIDNKRGKVGNASLQKLMDKYGRLPKTYTVRTPTGGYHLYYAGQCKNSQSKIGQDLDTRGQGGYVVCAGSRIDGAFYTEIGDTTECAPFPPWIAALMQKVDKPKAPTGNNPNLIQEGSRNATLASLAGSMRSYNCDHGTIINALLNYNKHNMALPLKDNEVRAIAKSISRYEPGTALAASDFLELPSTKSKTVDLWGERGEQDISKRTWIMKNKYTIGHTSLLIAPGGVGKSLLTMLDALSISTGHSYSGFEVAEKAPVWIYNIEDPKDELERRAAALFKHYGLKTKEEKGEVYITSGREAKLVIATVAKNQVVINKALTDYLINTIRERKVKLFIVDPLAMAHGCNENDNMQMTKVVEAFNNIAEQAQCAVCLVHHARKPGNTANPNIDANASRGASAVINSVRIAHTMRSMSEGEASKLGIERRKRRWFVRLDSAKANLEPPAEAADWYEKKSVILANGPNGSNGDNVGILEKANFDFVEKVKEAKDLLDGMTPKDKILNLKIGTETLLDALPKIMELDERADMSSLRKKLNDIDALNAVTPLALDVRAQNQRITQLLKSAVVRNIKDEWGVWPEFDVRYGDEVSTFRVKNLGLGKGANISIWYYSVKTDMTEVQTLCEPSIEDILC